jgi:hypothetical protein
MKSKSEATSAVVTVEAAEAALPVARQSKLQKLSADEPLIRVRRRGLGGEPES